MRKSRSSSNIPLLTSLQKGDARGRERARSTVRNSREPSLEGITPLASYRMVSGGASRKYSSQTKQLLRTPTTPSTFTGFKRSSNLSSFGSVVSSARKTKSPSDKKALQKQQYLKLQDFIINSGLFNPELAGKIRPPTIAIFVELVSVLLSHIIKTIPITLNNYVEVILKTLKLLRYPGQITNSTIKTVNTMHGWPQFLAIISWLIDKVSLQANYDAFREQQVEDVKAAFYMHDAVHEFLSSYYTASSTNTPEQYELLEQRLYEDMLQITGTDQNTALELNQRLETERKEVESIESKLREIEDENQKIKTQNLEKLNVIDKYEESKGNREKEVKDEIVQLKKMSGKCIENKTALVEAIKELEDCILKQSCKFKEKSDILNQIEELKRVIERKERKLAEYRLVRDDLDMELRSLVIEIERKVDAWNVSITKTFLPELKMLCLREKGFHSEGFLEEIKNILKKQGEIQEKLLKEYRTNQSAIEDLLKRKESLKQNHKAIDSNRRKLDDLRQSVQSLEEQNRNILVDLENCRAHHEQKVKKMEQQEINKIKDQETTITVLNERKEKLETEFCRDAKIYVSVIIEAHDLTVKSMQKIEEAVCQSVGDAKENLRTNYKNLQESFAHLRSLRETNARLYQTLEDDDKEN